LTTTLPIRQKRIVVVSGLAGAGKTTAARVLEDLGFFVVDNLPPMLIETLVTLADSAGGKQRTLAFVVDAREADFLADFGPAWDRIKGAGHDATLVFLDCSDDVLVRRFKETRRRHPLDDGKGVLSGIATERRLLEEVTHRADIVIDTRNLTVHELKQVISDRFSVEGAAKNSVTVLSFGFKYGLPLELDVCFDVRFLPNPFFVEELKAKPGLDPEVRAFVEGKEDTTVFVDKAVDIAAFLLPRFQHEGKAYVTFAIGCTGGRHRSVVVAEMFAARLRAMGVVVSVVHRDVTRS
jgi:UPF0042 nucleotide-binding protein